MRAARGPFPTIFDRRAGRHRRRAAPRAQRGRLPRRLETRPLRRGRRHGRPRRRRAPPRRIAVETIQKNVRAAREARRPPSSVHRAARREPLPHDPPRRGRVGLPGDLRAAQEDPSLAGHGHHGHRRARRRTHRLHRPRRRQPRATCSAAGRIFQISEDHSLVNEQLKAGAITEEEARTSRFRNIITRSVGFEEDVHVDVVGLEVEHGDAIVLCCDGLVQPGHRLRRSWRSPRGSRSGGGARAARRPRQRARAGMTTSR